MSEQDWQELMEEPPNGHGHGWRRGTEGGWQSLETQPHGRPKHRKTFLEPEIPHGTSSGYMRHRCRCAACTEWMSVYDRNRRNAKSPVNRRIDA